MKNDSIREKLQGLYTELEKTRSSDKQTEERLRSLAAEVKDTLNHFDSYSQASRRVFWIAWKVRSNSLRRRIRSSHPC